MANPSPPIVPNITTGAYTGRVATDRYDFESHINGNGFRHDATQVDLNPPITLDSVEYTTVQSVLDELAITVTPPTIQSATTVVTGIIRLSGDLNGTGTTATNPRVSGLQGNPVSNLVPTLDQVLTWNGTAWAPADSGNAFVAAGDLSGNNVSQTVINLTGTSNRVTVTASNIRFDSAVSSPTINQLTHASNPGQNLTIRAQSTDGAAAKGGDIIIAGGVPGASGLRGGVQLQLSTIPLVHVVEPILNQRVLGLVSNSTITNTNMPANTGDRVIFIADAATIPSSGNPSGGAILYATGGELFVKHQSGDSFGIGTIPNPSIWGDVGEQTYTNRSTVQTTTGSRGTAFTLNLNQAAYHNTNIKVDVMYIGKRVGSTDAAVFNFSIAYAVDGTGSTTAIGTLTNADPRTNGGASGWTIPDITGTSQTLTILSGANAATTINWLVITQLSIIQD